MHVAPGAPGTEAGGSPGKLGRGAGSPRGKGRDPQAGAAPTQGGGAAVHGAEEAAAVAPGWGERRRKHLARFVQGSWVPGGSPQLCLPAQVLMLRSWGKAVDAPAWVSKHR